MKWLKKGFIYGPDGTMPWARHSALTPTPILLNDTIRVYAGFRDEKGISRIGYVDLNAENPQEIMNISIKPVLDIGKPGTFDDNGLILGEVIEHKELLYMYYVGFQLVSRVKFLAFSGLAMSHDHGQTFNKVREIPILDRADEGLYIRAIHSVIIDHGIWKVWYATGNGWQLIDGTYFPQYNIRYIESKDGVNFAGKGTLCIDCEGNEYRIGRPRVYKVDNHYIMLYTKGTIQKDYLPGYAISTDGVKWERKDQSIGLSLSDTGWDSKDTLLPQFNSI